MGISTQHAHTPVSSSLPKARTAARGRLALDKTLALLPDGHSLEAKHQQRVVAQAVVSVVYTSTGTATTDST